MEVNRKRDPIFEWIEGYSKKSERKNRKQIGHKRCHTCNTALVFRKGDCEIRQGVGDWVDEKYWWYTCGCGHNHLIGNVAAPFSTYVSSKWHTEGATRVQVGHRAYDGGAGWRTILRHRPSFVLNGHRFQAREHDFRKDHGLKYRAWYVAKFIAKDCPVQPVQQPPPLICQGFSQYPFPYRWSAWTDYHENQVSGFTVPDY